MAERKGWVMRKRVSATIRNSASALHTISLESAEGPCLKKGGGVRSRVPKGMGEDCPRCGALGAAPRATDEKKVRAPGRRRLGYSLVKMLPSRSMRSSAM